MGIRVLPHEVAAKIAAGEVIVRPASVVKELVENSLDAGTKRIEIYLEEGGRSLVRVTDDGEGIAPTEVELALQRFATSKLETADDLVRISSYGFRGEALASMAEVSELTIETQKPARETGVLLRVKAGRVIEKKEIVRTSGTTVSVRNLFFNLPARRAFLRSEPYERRLVLEVVKNYALSAHHVGFEVRTQRDLLLAYQPKEAWIMRLKEVYPKDVELISVSLSHPLLSLDGFIVRPDKAEELQHMQRIFFNSRPVTYRAVYRAVIEAFGTQPAGKAPFFILKLNSPPEMLDVNIHPAKTEVRYRDERFLFDLLSQAIRKAIHQEAVASMDTSSFRIPPGAAPSFQPDKALKLQIPPSASANLSSHEPQAPVSQISFWQLQNSYIIAQTASGMIIVDQHAAHERILYEEMLERVRGSGARQPLLFPLIVDLAPEEFATFEEIANDLKDLGLDAKPFGPNQVIIEAFCADARISAAELKELFKEFNETQEARLGNQEKMAALIACKAAVKAGRQLSQPEMESLINRLFRSKTPFFCPHGRPTVIKFSMDDLAKRFGRM